MGQGLTFKVLGAALALSTVVVSTTQAQTVLPVVDVWASRGGNGIVGASTSTITAEDIARTPGRTIQELLSQEPGIQTKSANGGQNGVTTAIDMRGFGATAASNTLVLLNGRRLTDIDLSGVDLSTIPRDSIERIEISRGNSGAVLYGDGAVGGVINIVTKTGASRPSSARVEAGFGSFKQRELNASAAGSTGGFSASIFGSGINSDGYRVNSALRERSAIGDLRYSGDQGSVWFNFSADEQNYGVPGARRVTLTTSELDTDRLGATTPTAFSEKKGGSGTFGVSRMVAPGFELIVDGNLRRKNQTIFSSLFGFDTSDVRVLTTGSVTPRAIVEANLAGLPTKVTAGLDYYNSDLDAKRSVALTDPPYHQYSLNQQSTAIYWQQSFGVLPSTDISYGARLQQTRLSAGDRYDPTAPGAFDAGATPLTSKETQHALHLGFEHRFSPMFAVFGRVARSFRTPNVDERIGVGTVPVDFALKTQTSRDIEGGFRAGFGALEWQASVYDMRLNDEIMFVPAVPFGGANINLDPTHRYGVENSATLRLSETVRIKVGAAYTRALFRAGPNAGNDVPLVSRWTANAGLSWDLYQKLVVLDTQVRFVGARRMDNDQTNFQPLIPAHTLVDMRLGGEFRQFFWAVAIQNIFNVQYFDYAVASAATYGTYNAYPLPGRTYMVKAGATF